MKEKFDWVAEHERTEKLPYSIKELLMKILDGFKKAMWERNQSSVIIVDGKSGMGKTTLSFQIANYMTPNFTLDNVHFTPEEFLKGLELATKGDVVIFDEAMLISSRSALSSINRMVIQAMSMIRSRNIMVIFNVNSIFDLDRNLALSRADLLLHCYGESLTDRGKYMAFFKGADGMDRIKGLYLNGKKYYSYNTPRSNFFTHFPSYFVLNNEEYEIKKQKGIDKFLKSDKGTVGYREKKNEEALINALYHYHYDLGHSVEDTAATFNMIPPTVYDKLRKRRLSLGFDRV